MNSQTGVIALKHTAGAAFAFAFTARTDARASVYSMVSSYRSYYSMPGADDRSPSPGSSSSSGQ